MGLTWGKRKKVGKSTTLSASKGGVSASRKVGPVSVSTRGGVNVRLGKGLRWKIK